MTGRSAFVLVFVCMHGAYGWVTVDSDLGVWSCSAPNDESVLGELTARNPSRVIGVRDVTLDELYLYHVRGSSRDAAAATLERHSA